MKTLTADVSGRVQGVGFRSFVEQAAARWGLTLGRRTSMMERFMLLRLVTSIS